MTRIGIIHVVVNVSSSKQDISESSEPVAINDKDHVLSLILDEWWICVICHCLFIDHLRPLVRHEVRCGPVFHFVALVSCISFFAKTACDETAVPMETP